MYKGARPVVGFKASFHSITRGEHVFRRHSALKHPWISVGLTRFLCAHRAGMMPEQLLVKSDMFDRYIVLVRSSMYTCMR